MCVSCSVNALIRTIEVTILMHVLCLPCSVDGLLRTIELLVPMHVMCVCALLCGYPIKNYSSERPYGCDVCAL